jgi:hypothetical protein
MPMPMATTLALPVPFPPKSALSAKAHRNVRPVAAPGHAAMRSVLGGPLRQDRRRDMAARIDAEADRSSSERSTERHAEHFRGRLASTGWKGKADRGAAWRQTRN